MKIKKLLLPALCLVMASTTVGCGGGAASDSIDVEEGATLYTYEAEDTYLIGQSGPVFSGEASGYGMVKGKNSKSVTDENVLKSISNGYFVSYLNAKGVTLTFDIVADKATTDNKFYVRMASEWGSLEINPSNVEISVNGTALEYDEFIVSGKRISDDGSKSEYATPFKNFEISTGIDLVEGENEVTISIADVNYGLDGIVKYGPGIDCISISTESVLTWDKYLEDFIGQLSDE